MSSNATDSPESAANVSSLGPQRLDSESSDIRQLAELTAGLSADSLKQQLQAIHALAALGGVGEPALAKFIQDRMAEQNPDDPTAAHGSAYQMLYQGSSAEAKALIQAFPDGLVCPQSDRGVDYRGLQMLLVQKKYQMADKVTMQKLCELAGEQAIERKWVYFTEINQMPLLDLQAIDLIWGLYSEDKFGWSKQRQLWLRLGQDWNRLWTQLQWKTDGAWTRYPNEFIWDLSAPVGHLPLSNQLRGVRTMDSLLCHPAWSD
ncbi:MAG: GUN4 N-terminal ARM-like repeat domain-containing protein [Phormidesmis sp.]